MRSIQRPQVLHCTVLLTLTAVALLLAAHASAQPAGSSSTKRGGPPVTCNMLFQGGEGGSIQEANIQCTGGTITAALGRPTLVQQLQRSSKGVRWQPASSTACGVVLNGCVVAVCGASSTDSSNPATAHIKLHVADVRVEDGNIWGVVCIAGNTKAVLQGANVTGNNIAGLLVSGSADVTLTGSTFDQNNSPEGDGTGPAALAINGSARVQVVQSLFTRNNFDEHGQNGGAIAVTGNATLSIKSSQFIGNTAWYGRGAGLFVGDQARVTVANSTFRGHVGTWGGAVSAWSNASVTLVNCTLEDSWGSWGGAIYADDNSTVKVLASRLVSNVVKDYTNRACGGACYLYDTATVSLINTTVYNNTAQDLGGGVAVDSKRATLLLGPGTTITANTAKEGGGIFTRRLLDNLTFVSEVVVRNKALISDDIGVNITRLQLLSDAHVRNFVPRLGENKGLLPVRLRLSGPDNIPAAAFIQAVLDGRPVATGAFNPVTGLALLNINLQKPPGTYNIRLEVPGLIEKFHTSMSVTVVSCGPGEVRVQEEHACLQCPQGSYNFDAHAKACSPCPDNAVCENGTIIPEPGYYSSSMRSDQPHRCLHPTACVQNHTALQQQQQQQAYMLDSAAAEAAFMAAQCAKGHEGNLCGRCRRGFGQRLSSFNGRCRPCTSSSQVIVVFIFAAVASLAFIKLLCTLQSIQSAAALRRAGQQAVTANTAAAGTTNGAAAGKAAGKAGAAVGAVAVTTRGPPLETAGDSKLPSPPPKVRGLDTAASDANVPDNNSDACSSSSSSDVEEAAAGTAQPPRKRQHVPPGDLLKPFVVYLQWMLVVASVNVEWPQALLSPFTAVSWLFAASQTSTGLDCLLAGSHSKLPLPIQKVLFGLLMPLALLALLFLWDIVAAVTRRRLRQRRRGMLGCRPVLQRQTSQPNNAWLPKGALVQTAIVLTFFFLPSLLRTAYGMFACVRLDKPPSAAALQSSFMQYNAVGTFWLLDTDQRCFSGYHKGWSAALGVPLLVLLCGVVPFGIVGYLWRNRRRLEEPYFMQHYGFLYESYRPSKCYWEGVVAMQTCVVVAISVFGATLGAGFQLILLTTAFGAALLLLAAFKPFAAAGANLLGMQSCGCLMLSAQAALVFNMLAALSEDNTLPEASQAANGVAAVVLVINVVFVLSVFWRVLRAVDWQKVLGLAQRMRKAAVPLCGRAAGGGGCCVGRGVAKTLSV